MNDLKEKNTTEQKPDRWKSAISVAAVLIIAFIIVKMLMRVLIPILVGIILIANRDLVGKAIKFIYKQYKDETYKGLLATLAAFFLFTPFVVFLFCRSIYYMFTDGSKKPPKEQSATSTLINLAVKEKVKDFLEDEEKA